MEIEVQVICLVMVDIISTVVDPMTLQVVMMMVPQLIFIEVAQTVSLPLNLEIDMTSMTYSTA